MAANQRQTINGSDNVQIMGDVTVQLHIKKELANANSSIRSGVQSTELAADSDKESTILVRKLENGGFNIQFIEHAIQAKLSTLGLIIDYANSETGKKILDDIYSNLLSVINMNYVSQLNEGESLRASIKDIIQDLSSLCKKYEDLLKIDEAFLEGLLYIATSRCALKWRIANSEESHDDSESN